jgi:hypothetical protein
VARPYSDTWQAVQLTWQLGDATRGRPYSADVDRTVTWHADTWQASVQDTWRHQDATRVMLIWHFGRTIGQLRGDTCHHSQGDTWHADVSMLTWQMTGDACTERHVAAWQRRTVRHPMWQQVDQSERDTCQLWLAKKGCHVAHSGEATWHPMVGGFWLVLVYVAVVPGVLAGGSIRGSILTIRGRGSIKRLWPLVMARVTSTEPRSGSYPSTGAKRFVRGCNQLARVTCTRP